MIPQFQSYCQMWSSDVAQISNDSDRITYFREHLPELLLDHETVRAIITQMAKGKKWPDLRQSGIFNHEVLLYLDPSRRFSVRVYFHPPQSHTDIHDHTSWGVSGTPFGRLSVISYACEGDIDKGHATLHRKQQKLLKPGEVDLTRPWEKGIHQTGSADNTPNVMISAYGRPGRRLFVNRFEIETGKVERMYPPRLLRRTLAKAALNAFL